MKLLSNRFQILTPVFMVSGAALIIVTGSLFLPVSGSAAADIIDISYDKCASPSRTDSSVGHHSIGIIGVNGGGDWEKNPCLKDELNHFDSYELYVNTNYPSNNCPTSVTRANAFNCGYNLGLWDVRYASSQGAHSYIWWLDVEEGPGITWSGRDSINSSFLYGLAKGLQAQGAGPVGYYSTKQQWGSITGGWRSNGLVWYATGSIGRPPSSIINNACHSNFTGGQAGYYQYIVGSFDHDEQC
jgi:hypothetical protein